MVLFFTAIIYGQPQPPLNVLVDVRVTGPAPYVAPSNKVNKLLTTELRKLAYVRIVPNVGRSIAEQPGSL